MIFYLFPSLSYLKIHFIPMWICWTLSHFFLFLLVKSDWEGIEKSLLCMHAHQVMSGWSMSPMVWDLKAKWNSTALCREDLFIFITNFSSTQQISVHLSYVQLWECHGSRVVIAHVPSLQHQITPCHTLQNIILDLCIILMKKINWPWCGLCVHTVSFFSFLFFSFPVFSSMTFTSIQLYSIKLHVI